MSQSPRPPYESPIDRQIREAIDRGDFDNLPGSGRPLNLGRPGHERTWAERRMEGEDLAGVLPGPLGVRRQKQDIQQTLADVSDEETARAVVVHLNEQIVRSNVLPWSGPTIITGRLDVEATLAEWRRRRSGGGADTPDR